MPSEFVELGQEMGLLLEQKNAAYGDAFVQSVEFLLLLYPNGVSVDQYRDLLTSIRMFDKMKRVATDPDFAGEDARKDLIGYAMLNVIAKRRNDQLGDRNREALGEAQRLARRGEATDDKSFEVAYPQAAALYHGGALQGRSASDLRMSKVSEEQPSTLA